MCTPPPPPPLKVLVKDAAAQLGVTPTRLYRAIRGGELQVERTTHGHLIDLHAASDLMQATQHQRADNAARSYMNATLSEILARIGDLERELKRLADRLT